MKRSWSRLKENYRAFEDYSLIPVQDNHIEKIRIWRNEQISILRQQNKISRREQKNYFEKTIFPSMKEKKPKNILMSFLYKNELIGYGGLVHINAYDRRAEISFLLSPDYINDKKIYARKHLIFLKLITSLAFCDLDLNKIYTETWSVRIDHIKNLENFGFKLEGILKSHVLIDGIFENALIHRMLRVEYEKNIIS